MTVTPEFQGTHLWDRLCWAKETLDGVQSDYRVVYEDKVDECAKVMVPDPNWPNPRWHLIPIDRVPHGHWSQMASCHMARS